MAGGELLGPRCLHGPRPRCCVRLSRSPHCPFRHSPALVRVVALSFSASLYSSSSTLFRVFARPTVALAAALVDEACRVVEDAQHRHEPVRVAVGAGDVRAAGTDLLHRQADACGKYRGHEGQGLASVHRPPVPRPSATLPPLLFSLVMRPPPSATLPLCSFFVKRPPPSATLPPLLFFFFPRKSLPPDDLEMRAAVFRVS